MSGVPMKYFPLLAACEIAGAVGLILGIWWSPHGVAAGLGLLLYFSFSSASRMILSCFGVHDPDMSPC